MAEILIGTSGFSYDDWKEAFYPPGMARKDYLTFYASHFKVIELNFSYYQIPKASRCEQMLAKTDGELVFMVKAFNRMTHEINESALGEILPLFLDGISPFLEAGRLGGILLQFPQSFHYRPENRSYLKTLLDNLTSWPVFVEFRQKEWLKETVFRTLQELKAGFVCVDEPPLPSLIPPIVIHTSPMGYIRFHGRNSRNWYGTGSTARYDYLYSEEELRGWKPRIKDLAQKTEKLFIFFNNHPKAQAIKNARMLINLLN